MMINKITTFFKNNDFLKALSKSFLLCLPLFIIGSFSLLITNFPVDEYIDFFSGLADGKIKLVFDYISRGTFDIISIMIVISVCYNYASIKKFSSLNIFSMVIAGVSSYLALVYEPGLENAFGIKNLFTSIVVCLVACNIYFQIMLIIERKKKNLLGNGNYYFQQVIKSFFPTVVIIGLAALVKVILIMIFDTSDINAIIAMPLILLFKSIKSDFISGFLYVLLVHSFWSFGMHGGNILEGVVEENFLISETGGEIFTKTFNDIFVLMGGAGALLSLVIAILIFSKQKSTKKLGLVSLITVPFNINELMIFGLPIVLNPSFIIPFILSPLICFLTSYASIKLGIVPLPSVEVNWTTPVIFSGYLATGSISGSILQIFNLAITVFMYMPFVKKYDKRLEQEFEENIKNLQNALFDDLDQGRQSKFLHSSNILSGVARQLVYEIDEGIKKDRFEIYYQGQFNEKGECYGAEALLRFKYRNKINIVPPLIIELAKESNLIYQLEKYLFTKVVKELQKGELKDLVISFNVTIPTLMNAKFEEDVLKIINNDHELAKHINIELTEESTFCTEDDVIGKIQRLSKIGFVFSIDDFGMGHTSLLYLQTNCFKELKLDGSLVKQLALQNTNEKIISSIVYLSETIKFIVVAEYVETLNELRKLQELGVYHYQGYYFAKPMPYIEFVKALDNQNFWKN